METSKSFMQIKILHISLIFASIAFYVLLIVLSVLVHYNEGQLASFIIILIFGLVLRLMALYAALKELYGITIAFAILMTFHIVFMFITLTIGETHPINLIGFFLHSVVTMSSFLFAHQIRDKQLKQLATVVFCSPSAPVLMNGTQQSYSSPTALTAPVRVNFMGAVTQGPTAPAELDLPPDYETAVRYPHVIHDNNHKF